MPFFIQIFVFFTLMKFYDIDVGLKCNETERKDRVARLAPFSRQWAQKFV